MNKCGVIALQDIFLIILFVASVSFLLNYQIGQTTVYIASENDDKEDLSGGLSRGLSGGHGSQKSLHDGQIVGRSLNMLGARENSLTSLLSRLLKIEKSQLEQIRRRRVGIIGSSSLSGDQFANMRRSFTSSKQVMEHIKDERVIGSKAVVIQGNYSMILCVGEASSCPESIRNAAGELQMINRNMVIEHELCKPRRICAVANSIHEYKDGRRLDRPCITGLEARTYSKSQLSTHFAMIYVTSSNQGDSIKRNTTLDAIVQSNLVKDISSLWTFTKYPMTFQFGALLQLEVLVTSFNPLRLYISPSAVVGPVDALEEPQLFRKQMALDELLQYIGEEYGLSAFSQWWYTLQSLLVKTLVSAEIAASKRYQKLEECGRCFSAYKAVIICMNIRHCYIIKLTPILSELIQQTTVLLPSLLHLLTSERTVSIDVLNALEEVQRLYGYKICENNISGQDCLTYLDLFYLLNDRRETMANTDLIKMYPTHSSSMFTPFLNDICAKYSFKEGRSTANFHYILMSLQKYYSELSKSIPDNIDVSDELDIYGTNENMDYTLQMTNYSGDTAITNCRLTHDIVRKRLKTLTATIILGYTHFEECSEDVKTYKELKTLKLEPEIYLQQISENEYQATVDYDVIMIEIYATAKHCSCAISFGDWFKSQRQYSFTLGLGENVLKLVLIDTRYQDPRVLRTIRISIHRTMRGRLDEPIETTKLRVCSLKQDCSLPYTPKDECGLYDAHTNWQAFNQFQKPRCKLGDNDGSWVVPCKDCMNINSCFWKHARWEPMQCRYTHYSSMETSNCLKHKKLLFIGDSTNRGILHYIIEQINGTLHSMDKTHSIKEYTHLNSGMTNMTFGYYPHFWLPANHRPKFHKIIYQLIKRSLPLENNSNTVIVVGGVHWIAKKHINIILEALKRTGLGNITKVVKGLGAGFHQNISGVRFVNKENQSKLLHREQDVFKHAKNYGFKVIGTFKMTMSRYKDYTQGKCACHFHKISKIAKANTTEYKVEGEINAAYSQILLHNICDQT